MLGVGVGVEFEELEELLAFILSADPRLTSPVITMEPAVQGLLFKVPLPLDS